MTRPFVLLTGAVLLGGCATPMNLAYDFGRSYTASFQTQADLTRPSVAAAQYRLSGLEGAMIRLRVEDSTSDTADERQQNAQNNRGQ